MVNRNLEIYKMDLLETKRIEDNKFNDWLVTRVPGGWLMQLSSDKARVFVPYNEEFKNKK